MTTTQKPDRLTVFAQISTNNITFQSAICDIYYLDKLLEDSTLMQRQTKFYGIDKAVIQGDKSLIPAILEISDPATWQPLFNESSVV